MNRQAAEIIELKADLENERKLKEKAQNDRKMHFLNVAKDTRTLATAENKKINENNSSKIPQKGRKITTNDPEFKYVELIMAKCQEKEIELPDAYYIQNKTDAGNSSNMVGLIKMKQKLTNNSDMCLLCERRFYPKYQDSIKMEPSFGVAIDCLLYTSPSPRDS